MGKVGDTSFALFLAVFIPFGAAITFVGLPLAYVSLIVFPVVGVAVLLGVSWWLAFLIWWFQLAPLLLANINGGSIFVLLLLVAIGGNGWLYYKGFKATVQFLASCAVI